MASGQELEILARIKGLKAGSSVRQAPVTIIPYSPEALGGAVAGGLFGAPAAPASATWPSANLAVAWPFVLNQYVTVRKLFLYVGSAQAGNVDVGIYDEAYARKVSSGSTALGAVTTVQEFDVADTDLGPGRYYLAVALSSTSGTVFKIQSASGVGEGGRVAGMAQMASALPLPATFTPAAAGTALLPVSGLTLRTLV